MTRVTPSATAMPVAMPMAVSTLARPRTRPSTSLPCGAERHAHANLRYALRHRLRHDAEDPDGREQQRKTCKRGEQPGGDARSPHGVAHPLIHRLHFRERQVRVELPDFLADRGSEARLIEPAADEEPHACLGRLEKRNVRIGDGCTFNRAVSDVGHDANDFCANLEPARPHGDGLADRIGVRPERLGRGFIDEHDSRTPRPVVGRKQPPFAQLNTDSRKVFWTCPMHADARHSRPSLEWAAIEGGYGAAATARHRRAVGHADRFHTGQSSNAIGELRKENTSPFGVVICIWQIDPGGQQALGAHSDSGSV